MRDKCHSDIFRPPCKSLRRPFVGNCQTRCRCFVNRFCTRARQGPATLNKGLISLRISGPFHSQSNFRFGHIFVSVPKSGTIFALERTPSERGHRLSVNVRREVRVPLRHHHVGVSEQLLDRL